MSDLKARVEKELRTNILPFWLNHTIDHEFGGFHGQITNDLVIDAKADKGLILNTRILWTFSKAYSVYREDVYLAAAARAYDYILRHFGDGEFGGVYWMLNYRGEPSDTKKRVYGQAFTLYALAEYYLATRDDKAIKRAIALYDLLETASHDANFGGYFETYEREWSLAQDQRLSQVDMDEKKSMNTHLHMLEAHANLYRAWPDESLRNRLRELIEIFLKRIIDRRSHHLLLFFDEDWTPKSDVISFGHDIEGSWLLCEAAEIYGDPDLLKEVRQEAVRMAEAVYREGMDAKGGIVYEAKNGQIFNSDKHWWPQAEAVVGFLNAYQISGQYHFRAAAHSTWEFIDQYIVDREHGEWFSKISRDGVPSKDKYKVDAWKCPYHNSRACFEVMERVEASALEDQRSKSDER